MAKKSKALAAAIALNVAASTLITTTYASSFPDMSQAASWAQDAIQKVAALGFMQGDANGDFRPTDTITRQEVATILAKALHLAPSSHSSVSFTDVSSKDWGYQYINAVTNAKIMSGDTSGGFRPNDPISREELAVVLIRALNMNVVGSGAQLNVADKGSISSWALDYVATAMQLGLMHGDGTNFNPKQSTTRQEVAVILVPFTLLQPGSGQTPGGSGNGTGGGTGGGTTGGDTGGSSTSGFGGDTGPVISPVVSGEVTAINANEIRVSFPQPVNSSSAQVTSHYNVLVNGQSAMVSSATLQSNPYQVILKLTTPLRNGDRYEVDVQNVMASNYTLIAPYVDTYKLFEDTTKPALSSASFMNNQLQLTFNKPVTDGMTVKVDGVIVADGSTSNKVTLSTIPGNYSVLTPVISLPTLLTTGYHTVIVYNASDFDMPANEQSVLPEQTFYIYNSTAPYVYQVKPNTQNSFWVTFSQSLAQDITPANVVIKKGSYTFNNVSVVKDTSYDPTGKSYLVTVNSTDPNNPLYATGVNYSQLSLSISNYENQANLVGATYSTGLTLTRPSGPSVLGAGANSASNSASNGTLTIGFNEPLLAADYNKITVMQGNTAMQVIGASPESGVDNNKLDITLAAPVTAGTYTVSFAGGAVTDENSNLNTTVSTTVNYAPSAYLSIAKNSVPGAVSDGEAGILSTDKDVITVAYGTTMNANATYLNSYEIDGHGLPGGTLISFTDTTDKSVKITLPASSITADGPSMFTITKNVTAQNGEIVANSDGSVDQFLLNFTNNTPPTLSKAQWLVDNSSELSTNKILLTYSENMGNGGDTDDYQITINGVAQPYTVGAITGDTVELDLTNTVNVGQYATLSIVPVGPSNPTMSIADADSNVLKTTTTVSVNGVVE